LGEEGGAREGDPNKPRWIVDPLDGTSNFLHGVPHFAISIAVEEPKPNGRGEITQGLVYQPFTDESFWAEKGRGAWLHDRRLGEEGGAREGDPNKPRWIVDPLDGTSNFLHGVPHFAISIAVEEPKPNGRGEITQGLVYQPFTDESFWAEKGRGAWLHDRRLR